MANDQDQVRGKFWEARFKCQPLLDEQAVLTCSMYVNLNPVRARKARTPEESRFTSVYERIVALRSAKAACSELSTTAPDEAAPLESAEGALWICKLELADCFLEPEASARTGSGAASMQVNPFPSRRLSNKGFLPMTEQHYLSIRRWIAGVRQSASAFTS